MGDESARQRAATAVLSGLCGVVTLVLLWPATGFTSPLKGTALAMIASLWPHLLWRRAPVRCAVASIISSLAWLVWVGIDGCSDHPAAIGLWIAGFAVASLAAAVSFLRCPSPRWLGARAVPFVPSCVLLSWTAVGEASAAYAMKPHPSAIESTQVFAPRAVDDVVFTASDRVAVAGWLVRADPKRCVLLLAGIRGDRRTNIERAQWWLSQDWSVLLIDLRGTGASDPAAITFGWNERLDVQACWEGLLTLGFEAIGVHATSLGAAAFVYAVHDGLSPHPSFAVLEELYGDARKALAARLPLVPVPELLLTPLVGAVEYRLRVDAQRLRPVDDLADLYAPLLVMQGRDDHKLGDESGEDLLLAAGASPKRKRLVWFDGLGHVDLWRHARGRCERSVADFLRDLPGFVPR